MGKYNSKVFSYNLTYYLAKWGIQQNQLADIMNVSEATVSEWVNGKKMPRIDRIETMAELFHCKKSDLIDGRYEEDEVDGRIGKICNDLTKLVRKLSSSDKEIILKLIEQTEIVAERLSSEKES